MKTIKIEENSSMKRQCDFLGITISYKTKKFTGKMSNKYAFSIMRNRLLNNTHICHNCCDWHTIHSDIPRLYCTINLIAYLCHTLSNRHCSHPSGLCTSYCFLSFWSCKLHTPLWHLCCLPWASLSHQNYCLMSVQQLKKLATIFPHRQSNSFPGRMKNIR